MGVFTQISLRQGCPIEDQAKAMNKVAIKNYFKDLRRQNKDVMGSHLGFARLPKLTLANYCSQVGHFFGRLLSRQGTARSCSNLSEL